jgi:hypothetical protein
LGFCKSNQARTVLFYARFQKQNKTITAFTKRKKEEGKRGVGSLLLLLQYSSVFEILKKFKSLRRRCGVAGHGHGHGHDHS